MLDAPERIPTEARASVENLANEVYVSAVVAWEITIKHALGKLRLPSPPEAFVGDRMTRLGLRLLPVSIDHALAVSRLPLIHADPFDRLLVAQARVEGLALVTTDRNVLAYLA